jgi:hypothetical protein
MLCARSRGGDIVTTVILERTNVSIFRAEGGVFGSGRFRKGLREETGQGPFSFSPSPACLSGSLYRALSSCHGPTVSPLPITWL